MAEKIVEKYEQKKERLIKNRNMDDVCNEFETHDTWNDEVLCQAESFLAKWKPGDKMCEHLVTEVGSCIDDAESLVQRQRAAALFVRLVQLPSASTAAGCQRIAEQLAYDGPGNPQALELFCRLKKGEIVDSPFICECFTHQMSEELHRKLRAEGLLVSRSASSAKSRP
jgi:hypothetical protein